MKKILVLIIIAFLSTTSFVLAGVDKLSQEYLQNTNHFTITKPLAEMVAKRAIKKALKKETGANFDVKFEGYTTSSIKRGVFKSLEISTKDMKIDEIEIPYLHLKSLDEYNYIDYTKNPIVFKCDMTYAYEILLQMKQLMLLLKTLIITKFWQKLMPYQDRCL